MKIFHNVNRMLSAFALLFVSSAWSHPGHGDPAGAEEAFYELEPVQAQPRTLPELHLPALGKLSSPWTGTKLNNDPNNFQFAIVSDRTGGVRPGIFETAVEKLNLLQPEFVMSVGDLIMGYTAKNTVLDQQWDEFESLVAKLTMPFFYVPGNHDMANPTEKAKWRERFGPNYYHFKYGNVLFLCLDTEDAGHGALSKEQLAYFEKALKDNQDVRWTLVFMHRPIWAFDGVRNLSAENEDQRELLKKTGWLAMENALKGRKHTVYAGHLHDYTKFVRNDSKYFILASTGGGSALRGVHNHGEFDEVVWITMTDDGPIMANLLLDGILDENLRTDDVSVLVRTMLRNAVAARVAVTEPLPFGSAPLTMRLNNESTMPLTLNLQPPAGDIHFEPTSTTVTLPPKSSKDFDFTVDGSKAFNEVQLKGLKMPWTGTYSPKDKPKIQVSSNAAIVFDPTRVSAQAVAGTAVDGNFDEWTDLWSDRQGFYTVVGAKKAWGGMADASLEVASQFDDDFVYVAARVKDDSLVPVKGGKFKKSDHAVLFLAPIYANDMTSSTATAAGTNVIDVTTSSSNVAIRVMAGPSDDPTSGVIRILGEHAINAACVNTPGGYQIEMAVPVELLNETTGEAWTKFALNVKINDRDTKGSKQAELWWKPDWDKQKGSPKNGWFVRE